MPNQNSSTRRTGSEFKKQGAYGGISKTLDKDGLTFPNTRIKKGDAIFCNVSGKKHPHVVKNKKSDGVVDSTILFQNANGGQTAKTRIREQRIPQIGDKIQLKAWPEGDYRYDVHGQEDLPFTEQGIVPDIIVNPHAIPSRMTIGHVFECVASKLAALLGTRIDATAFSHKPVDTICKMLKDAGFSEDGKEVMYHPHTGKRLKGRVFIGPTFYQRLKHMVEDKIHARARGKVSHFRHDSQADGCHAMVVTLLGRNGTGLWCVYGASAVLYWLTMLSSDAFKASKYVSTVVYQNCR